LPELLAPAGNWDCARAAVENGADAIYFGLDRFNARMRAENFSTADLPELMAFLHRRGVKGYVTLNTLVFTEELPDGEQYLKEIIAAGVDALIVQDIGICRLIRHLSPDFPIHASTQMTITSAAGVEFARDLGCELVVLARECSLKEIDKIQQQTGERDTALPLEVFVHGALCVAYSGQCLTSEALGGRSANRGECAQACRMSYDLIADGQPVDLGDRKYLLSPQDLSGLEVLPDLVQAGVACLKIEGRLKSPEYVANVTRVYRQALDRVLATGSHPIAPDDRYNLEMAFSRGLYTGWFRGIDNQALVHARFGKKRGVYLGQVTRLHKGQITVQLEAPLKPGDGVVFDSGHPDQPEEGGRVYSVDAGKSPGEAILRFGHDDLNLKRIRVGDRLWKTSDPELERRLRQSFTGNKPQHQRPIHLEVHGTIGQPLTLLLRDDQGHIVQVDSAMPLEPAHTRPLTDDRLQEQLGRMGNTPFCLGRLTNKLDGQVMLPVSELNRLRREGIQRLDTLRSQPKRWQLYTSHSCRDLLPQRDSPEQSGPPGLRVLVRNLDQLRAALEMGISTVYCEFEDPRRYRDAVQQVRQHNTAAKAPQLTQIYVAPPRITKPGENWILQQVLGSNADGYLVRNYDHLTCFADYPCIGDFSLNVANPLTAAYFKQRFGLQRLTASYDLNIQQLENLLKSCPPDWFEVTIHQRMPMFHMEHCVFCAFLSEGIDYTNCGRPCETHAVRLRDRIGTEHILQADAGCRNTVFNGTAQTGAEYVQRLLQTGLHQFRIEFVQESATQIRHTIHRYRQLLNGEISGSQLWQELQLQSRLGVTRGPLDR
jgi:putative protease